jgi:predicted MFS family arabinose efflux permease
LAAIESAAGVNASRPHRRSTLPGPRVVGAVLFLALFAAQAAVIALTPVLAEVAADFDVTTAAAGQLRTAAGLAATATALAAGLLARRLDLRALLVWGAGALAVGALTSAAAPSLAVLAGAQALIGAGVALVTTAATAAAAEWTGPENRARVLSLALLGPPSAWIVGMPAIGALGEASWRYGWLALPLAAGLLALAAGLAVAPRRAPAGERACPSGLARALREPGAARWATGELLANSAWTGTLVYAGALFTEEHGASLSATGILLAVAAVAYVAGNLAFRGRLRDDPRPLLARLALLLAVVVAAFGAVRPGIAVSAALLACAGFLAAARTLVGNAAGLEVAPQHRLALMAVRSATLQLGYLVGAATGGAALALGGYGALGAALGTLFAAAALPMLGVRLPASRARRRAAVSAPASAPTSVT